MPRPPVAGGTDHGHGRVRGAPDGPRPGGDWPAPFPPRPHNLLVAAERAYTVESGPGIDCPDRPAAAAGEFDSDEQDRRRSWPASADRMEQALFYPASGERRVIDRQQRRWCCANGRGCWHAPDQAASEPRLLRWRRRPGSASFMKMVDPEEREGEARVSGLLPGLVPLRRRPRRRAGKSRRSALSKST